MTAETIEVILSVALVEWIMQDHPNKDIETTRFQELGRDEVGVLLTIGDAEFEIEVTKTS